MFSAYSRGVSGFVSLAMAIVLAGCSGYQAYHREDFAHWPPVSDGGDAILRVGDEVRVCQRVGAEVDGFVDKIGADALVVSGVSVPFGDIESIQIRSIRWGPTAVVLGGVVAAGLVFLPPEPTFSTDNSK